MMGMVVVRMTRTMKRRATARAAVGAGAGSEGAIGIEMGLAAWSGALVKRFREDEDAFCWCICGFIFLLCSQLRSSLHPGMRIWWGCEMARRLNLSLELLVTVCTRYTVVRRRGVSLQMCTRRKMRSYGRGKTKAVNIYRSVYTAHLPVAARDARCKLPAFPSRLSGPPEPPPPWRPLCLGTATIRADGP